MVRRELKILMIILFLRFGTVKWQKVKRVSGRVGFRQNLCRRLHWYRMYTGCVRGTQCDFQYDYKRRGRDPACHCSELERRGNSALWSMPGIHGAADAGGLSFDRNHDGLWEGKSGNTGGSDARMVAVRIDQNRGCDRWTAVKYRWFVKFYNR